MIKSPAISATSFVIRFFDNCFYTSASFEMIRRITIIEFLFNFFIKFFICTMIYVFHIYTLVCQINVPPPRLLIFEFFSNPPSHALLDPTLFIIPNIFYSPIPKLTISIQLFQYQNFSN